VSGRRVVDGSIMSILVSGNAQRAAMALHGAAPASSWRMRADRYELIWRRIFAHTQLPFALIYVDGKSPE
jgi:hypothetical protein